MTLEVERIAHNGEVYALVLRKDVEGEGINFITPESYPLQVGVQTRKTGDEVEPHAHKTVKKEIEDYQEFIYVIYGKVEATVYDGNGKKFSELTLCSGDCFLQTRGGHGFRFLEDTKIIEVKQGPYDVKTRDKEKL